MAGAVVARRPVEPLGSRSLVLTADSTVEAQLRAALDRAEAEFGPPDVVVYNAALVRADAVGELSGREHEQAWAVNVVGAITAAGHVLPGMARRGAGTFLVTGGMPQPRPEYVSLSLGKAALRTLVDLLDQQFGPAGMHVATVTVAGLVRRTGRTHQVVGLCLRRRLRRGPRLQQGVAPIPRSLS